MGGRGREELERGTMEEEGIVNKVIMQCIIVQM